MQIPLAHQFPSWLYVALTRLGFSLMPFLICNPGIWAELRRNSRSRDCMRLISRRGD
ncbi:hypothetical protein BDV06DRAFT_200785, partial [Aspergillus oleicola]